MRGEVFEQYGRVAFAIPAVGRPGAIQFSLGRVWPATAAFPAWADMVVAGKAVRIDPAILDNLPRLADCVAYIAHHRDDLGGRDQARIWEAGGERFAFWGDQIGGTAVVIVDSLDRLLAWGGGVDDGPERECQDASTQRPTARERAYRRRQRKRKRR